MNKQNIIRITLFVSILVFNPAVADTLRSVTNIQTNLNTTITENITSILHKRGLEEKSAKKRAEEFLGDDERLFSLMLGNLLYGCSDITKEEILEHLSTSALHRQSMALDSYAHLIDIYSKIKQSTPEKEMRKKLSAIAKSNAMVFG